MRIKTQILGILLSVLCLGIGLTGCGKTKESSTIVVSEDRVKPESNVNDVTTTDRDNTGNARDKKLYTQNNMMYLPDGRSGELLDSEEGYVYTSNVTEVDEPSIAKYRVTDLFEKFKSIDFELEYNGESYYFKCDLEKDGTKLTYNNIDTNMTEVEQDEGFCYGVPDVVQYLGVVGSDEFLLLGNLSWLYPDSVTREARLDTKPATLNGVSLDYVNYMKPFKDYIYNEPIWTAYMYSDEETAQVTDLWLDKEDVNFGVSFEGMEGNKFLGWHGTDPSNILIGYIAYMYGLEQ